MNDPFLNAENNDFARQGPSVPTPPVADPLAPSDPSMRKPIPPAPAATPPIQNSQNMNLVGNNDLGVRERTTERMIEGPEAAKSRQDLLTTTKSIIKDEQTLREQEFDIKAEELRQRAAYDESVREEHNQKIDKYEADLNARYDAYQASVDKLSSSGDYYANKTTGDKILAAIAIGLGAASMAYGNKENPALRIIDAAIERDIDLAKSQVAANKGALAELRDKFKDEQVAEHVLRESMYTKIANDLRKKADGMPPERQMIAVNARKMSAEADAKAAAERDKAAGAVQRTVEAPTMFKPRDLLDAGKFDKALESKQTLATVDKLESMLDDADRLDIQPGGRLNEAQKKFLITLGVATPESALFDANMEKLFQERVVALTGAAAPTKQMDAIRATLPQWRNDPKTFRALLKSTRDDALLQYNTVRSSAPNAELGGFPEYRQGIFGSTSSAEGASHKSRIK